MKRALFALSLLAACAGGTDADLLVDAQQRFSPLPSDYTTAARPIRPDAVTLGRMLYFENRLSKNHDISCNSCHDLAQYGVDGRRFSLGHRKQEGGRNAPTVYNAAAGLAQFWDGRAADVEAQAVGPIRNPVEMAMTSDQQVIDTLASMPEYVAAFSRTFPGQSIAMALIGDAIGAFERRLVTPDRFDRFLRGDIDALTAAERTGLRTFVEVGCATCHSGVALGATSYRKAASLRPWPAGGSDLGRFEITRQEADKGVFKVPTLRNIARTAPYFHDASVATLDEAVRRMALVQHDRDLTSEQVSAIVTFLGALTGELPTDLIQQPELPKSGATTPLPDPN